MFRLLGALALLAANLAAAAAPVQSPGPRWWGVIVGVGEYENLGPDLALEGPPNDVPLVLTWLQYQGVPRQHLTVLADKVARSDGLPNRGAILDALRALPGKVAPGDIVFLYFAGHGSQQPQGGSSWTKNDGMDEVFLPRDVKRWDAQSGQIDGAISGGEIGAAVQAVRARGAFVWLVFDSCHSATMARSLMIPRLRARAVPPEKLGVPLRPASSSARDLGGAATHSIKLQASTSSGGYVAFYAAQAVEMAPEMPLPAGEIGNQVHGLFTFALLKALGATGSGSYREVAHRILAYYATTYPTTTPEFEGSLDGAIGFPGSPSRTPGAWPSRRVGQFFRVDAGRLNGITPQSVLALYPAVSTPKGPTALGLLLVNKVSLTDSWAQPITDAKQLKEWSVARDRSTDVAAGVVRILRTGVDTTVRVAGPAACFATLPAPLGCVATAADASAEDQVRLATAIAKQPGRLSPGSEFTQDVDAADLFLLVKANHLFVMRSSSASDAHAVSIDLGSARAGDDLQSVMFRASRAVGLLRLAADFPERTGDFTADVRTRESIGRWRQVGGLNTTPVPFGAELSVELQNTSAVDMDVTILALDDNFGITPVYPVDQESNLLREGSARLEIPGWARTPGQNELVFIFEKAQAGRPHNLGYLAQPGIARHAQDAGLAGLLDRIGFEAGGTRSSYSDDDQRASFMRILRYDVASGT